MEQHTHAGRTVLRFTSERQAMNKLLKGSIAGAVGIALLLGGAGTLAYWNDSTTLAAGQVDTGALKITPGTASVVYESTGQPVVRAVPGDTIVITQPVTITASGQNLKASLSVDPSALRQYLSVPDVNFSWVARDASGIEVVNLTNLSAEQAASIKSVVLTATFPASVKNQDGQGITIPLSPVKIDLTQIA